MCGIFIKVEIYLIYFFWKINVKFFFRIRDVVLEYFNVREIDNFVI